jgi:hypothetical protein
MSPDPHAEKYHHFNPYNYVLNNPVNMIDPDGKDCIFTIEYGKDGKISGVKISSTIYITGSTSKERADQLTKDAKKILINGETKSGVKISFDIKYEYIENIGDDFKPGRGNNLLTFTDEIPEGTAKNGADYRKGGGVLETNFIDEAGQWSFSQTDNKGIIYKDASNVTIIHETGHLIGLSDRYSMVNLQPDVGFEKNLMRCGGKTTKIHQVQYELIGIRARFFDQFKWLYMATWNSYLNKMLFEKKTRNSLYNQTDFGMEIKMDK